MIPLDLPPKLWTPPALILPGQAETLTQALAGAGVPRHVRRIIEREIARTVGARSRDIMARVKRDADAASMPVLLALLAARRRASVAGGVVTIAKPAGAGDIGTGDALSSYTLGDFDFAGASQIAAAVMVPDNASVSIDAVSIGGVTPTTLLENESTGASSVGFYLADGPFSDSEIDVVLGDSSFGIRVVVYHVSGASHTPFHTQVSNGGSPSATGSLNIAAGGAALVGWGNHTSSGTPSATYSGVDDLEYATAGQSGQGTRFTGANAQAFEAAQTGLSVSVDFSSFLSPAHNRTAWVSLSPQ